MSIITKNLSMGRWEGSLIPSDWKNVNFGRRGKFGTPYWSGRWWMANHSTARPPQTFLRRGYHITFQRKQFLFLIFSFWHRFVPRMARSLIRKILAIKSQIPLIWCRISTDWRQLLSFFSPWRPADWVIWRKILRRQKWAGRWSAGQRWKSGGQWPSSTRGC